MSESVLFCTVCESGDHTAYRRLVDGVTITLCPDAKSSEVTTTLGKLLRQPADDVSHD